LVPLLVTEVTTPPAARPYSAEYTPVFTANSRTALPGGIGLAGAPALLSPTCLVVVGAVDFNVVEQAC
jgi:hypothetical protein